MARHRLLLGSTALALPILLAALAPVQARGDSPAPAAPFLVADVHRAPGMGSSPTALTPLGDRLLFFADDGVHGRQLWSTAGAPNATVRLTDVELDPYYSHFLLQRVGERAFVSLRQDLWVTDGTVAGTLLLPKQIAPLSGFGDLGDRLYFNAGGLWSTDGTAEGTVPVGAGAPSYSGDPIHPDPPAFGPAVGGRLFFRGVDDHSLWVTDGTVEGTVQIADVGWPEIMVAAGPRVFFIADSSQLWVSDGTAAGTGMVTDLGSDWRILGAVGDRLLYGQGDIGGWTLRASDGSPGDGVLLAAMSEPVQWWSAELDGLAVFRGSDPAHGLEPWLTDGTPAGTMRLRDAMPGPAGSNPVDLTSVGGYVAFVADDGLSGTEPWITDGTAAGTRRLVDLVPGPAGSMSSGVHPPADSIFARFGDALVFAANDGALGTELWGISLAGEDGTCVPDDETLCFHRGRFAVRVTWFDHRSGDSGVGHAVPGVGRTGTFWFFRPDNTELVVKLLDGRRINGYFWFFYGALTDVEYDLVVTDTLGERERTYHNPAGWSCGEGDTTAFPGAP